MTDTPTEPGPTEPLLAEPLTDPVPEPVPPKPRRGKTVAIVLLSVGLALALGAVAAGIVLVLQLQQRLGEAELQLDDQQRQIEEQKELLDKKETFGAAMTGLMTTLDELDGVPMATLVPVSEYIYQAKLAWSERRYAHLMDDHTARIDKANDELTALLADAKAEAKSNRTHTKYESVIDRLGRGFVRSVMDSARRACDQKDALACVDSDDPYVVHFDTASNSKPYMTDWIRTGIAYHEFAHVLQFTNPEPTEVALKSFKGDYETMADCFALTYLKGWTLDHRVWVSSYQYWDVSIGYGYTCNAKQRQAIRTWYHELGYHAEAITQ